MPGSLGRRPRVHGRQSQGAVHSKRQPRSETRGEDAVSGDRHGGLRLRGHRARRPGQLHPECRARGRRCEVRIIDSRDLCATVSGRPVFSVMQVAVIVAAAAQPGTWRAGPHSIEDPPRSPQHSTHPATASWTRRCRPSFCGCTTTASPAITRTRRPTAVKPRAARHESPESAGKATGRVHQARRGLRRADRSVRQHPLGAISESLEPRPDRRPARGLPIPGARRRYPAA